MLLLGTWTVIIEPRWVAHREIADTVPSWQGPPGLKVAVASDWHFSKRPLWRVMTLERARAIVAEINAAQPDVILLPGDFIADRDYKPEFAATPEDEIAQVLGGLKARLGVYAVMGNHDWWHDGAKFTAAFQRAGIQVLENDAVPLPGTALWVAGVGDDHTGHSDPVRAMARVPKAPRPWSSCTSRPACSSCRPCAAWSWPATPTAARSASPFFRRARGARRRPARLGLWLE